MGNRWDNFSILQRLAEWVDCPTEPGACWIWRGSKNKRGYGSINHGGVRRLVHRVVYELAHGPIPDGHVIDHLCRKPSCVNPAHLEAVTQKENCRRGIKGVLTTHCPQGHPYTPENTSVWNGMRKCLTCHAQRERERRRLRREGTHPSDAAGYGLLNDQSIPAYGHVLLDEPQWRLEELKEAVGRMSGFVTDRDREEIS